jgi:hypothetical protein
VIDDLESGSPDPDLPEYQRLTQLAEFTQQLNDVPWFTRVGMALEPDEEDVAEAYLSAAGFPGAGIGLIESWNDAAQIAENPEWNSDWWEAEEQLRAGLVTDALETLDETDVSNLLNHAAAAAAGAAGDAATEAALQAGFEDEAFVMAAAGMATAASYTMGLIIAAAADDDHPFALKFQLFEFGRCPVGVIGTTFSLF